MSQESVYNLLAKKKKAMTIDEIAEQLKTGRGSVSRCCDRLVKYKEIDFKMINIKRKKVRGTYRKRVFYVGEK